MAKQTVLSFDKKDGNFETYHSIAAIGKSGSSNRYSAMGSVWITEIHGVRHLAATDGYSLMAIPCTYAKPGHYRVTQCTRGKVIFELDEDEKSCPNMSAVVPEQFDEKKKLLTVRVGRALGLSRLLYDLYSNGFRIDMKYVKLIPEDSDLYYGSLKSDGVGSFHFKNGDMIGAVMPFVV